MRVLLDTNVVVSAILFGGVPRQVFEAALTGELEVVTSPALMLELESSLIRKFGFRSTVAASTRSELEMLAEVVEPGEVPRVLSGAADNEVLAAAFAGHVGMIVTGDRELLELERFEGIRLVPPRTLLDQMAEPDDSQ